MKIVEQNLPWIRPTTYYENIHLAKIIIHNDIMTFSPLLPFCEGNTLVTTRFPSQKMQNSHVFFDVNLMKMLKNSWVASDLRCYDTECIQVEMTISRGNVEYPDRKVHGANMGPIWGRQDPGGPHVDPMNFAIWAVMGTFHSPIQQYCMNVTSSEITCNLTVCATDIQDHTVCDYPLSHDT